MLDLERLRALHAVARYGTVSAAADVLHVTTSAVGELSMAAFPTAIRGLVPAALGRLRDAHPQLRVRVREDDPSASVPMVARGELDVAIVQDWNNVPLAIPEGLAKGVLFDDVADLALSADHPLAGQEIVYLKELAGDPWISSTPGTICCDWLTHTLRATDCEPRIDHMAYEYGSQLALVAAGFGAAILPRLGRCDVPAGVLVRPLRPLLTRRIYAIWRAEAAR